MSEKKCDNCLISNPSLKECSVLKAIERLSDLPDILDLALYSARNSGCNYTGHIERMQQEAQQDGSSEAENHHTGQIEP